MSHTYTCVTFRHSKDNAENVHLNFISTRGPGPDPTPDRVVITLFCANACHVVA